MLADSVENVEGRGRKVWGGKEGMNLIYYVRNILIHVMSCRYMQLKLANRGMGALT